MQTVKDFIGELGGTVAVANALKLPVSTVSGWNIKDSIPNWRIGGLKALAEQHGKPFPESLEPSDRAA